MRFWGVESQGFGIGELLSWGLQLARILMLFDRDPV